jgi:hypothetical protein
MPRGKYSTPQAFKAALEAHQKKRAKAAKQPRQRILQLDLEYRLVDRLLVEFPGQLVLKGGLALEMRLERARTTRDIDFRATGTPSRMLERMRRAGTLDHGDYLRFDINERARGCDIEGPGVMYDGVRLTAQAYLAGGEYGSPFGIDVAFGDPMTGPIHTVSAPDSLGFAGVAPPMIPIYPIETHVAEKVHAYTLRGDDNSRMKDLVDLALIATEAKLRPDVELSAATIRSAIATTFRARATHDVPTSLLPSPAPWAARYPRERDNDRLPWPTIEDVHAVAAAFLDPVLDDIDGTWDAAQQRWR